MFFKTFLKIKTIREDSVGNQQTIVCTYSALIMCDKTKDIVVFTTSVVDVMSFMTYKMLCSTILLLATTFRLYQTYLKLILLHAYFSAASHKPNDYISQKNRSLKQ